MAVGCEIGKFVWVSVTKANMFVIPRISTMGLHNYGPLVSFCNDCLSVIMINIKCKAIHAFSCVCIRCGCD